LPLANAVARLLGWLPASPIRGTLAIEKPWRNPEISGIRGVTGCGAPGAG
jgi:hypothetical protein